MLLMLHIGKDVPFVGPNGELPGDCVSSKLKARQPAAAGQINPHEQIQDKGK